MPQNRSAGSVDGAKGRQPGCVGVNGGRARECSRQAKSWQIGNEDANAWTEGGHKGFQSVMISAKSVNHHDVYGTALWPEVPPCGFYAVDHSGVDAHRDPCQSISIGRRDR